MNANRTRMGGFTLLELLVVLGILGILLSVSAPSYLGYRQSLLFRDAVQTVSQELVLAASKSLQANAAQQLTFTLGQAANGKMDLAPSGSSTAVTTATLPGDAYVLSVMQGSATVPTARIFFNGRGRPIGLSQPVNITVRQGSRTAVVRLLPSGKVTLP